jgi:DNA gyrase/topoisomerase IV subunit B
MLIILHGHKKARWETKRSNMILSMQILDRRYRGQNKQKLSNTRKHKEEKILLHQSHNISY